MSAVAILSMHTSPLLQPGTGDAGGMNVYVRELAGSLAQAGVSVRVYVRRWESAQPDEIEVEPGLTVVHVDAGPVELAKEDLPSVVDLFADGVAADIAEHPVSVLHANYWLSAVAGHRLKHELELPLVATFHTLARVKAEAGDSEPDSRARAEAEVIGCCDSICASNPVEAEQLIEFYGARPDRIELVPPGVDHAFFSPGDRRGALNALGLDKKDASDSEDAPTLLFVGRIQPLKGLTAAVEVLSLVKNRSARLVVVGGPSGPSGEAELERAQKVAADLGVADRTVWLKPQPHHSLSSHYRAADVVLVPSRSESFGLVALEAAACGVPVVATAVGGLRTLVKAGSTGFLVEGRNPQAMAERVDLLLESDGLAKEMGEKASTEARKYSWPTTAGRLRRLYADLAVRSLVECA